MALGPTWLDELPVDAVDGIFLAVMRSVDPGFGAGEISAGRDAMTIRRPPPERASAVCGGSRSG